MKSYSNKLDTITGEYDSYLLKNKEKKFVNFDQNKIEKDIKNTLDQKLIL